jgi:hypothetical protein
LREQHRRYVAFDRLREEQREQYWKWRHEHMDVR